MFSDVIYLDEPYCVVLRRESVDPKSIKPHEIFCETICSVISPGTEVAAYTGAPPLRPSVVYPRLVGYCNVAEVIECGSAVTKVKQGDRVLSFSSHRSHFILPEGDVLAVLSREVRSEDAAFAYLYHLGYDSLLKAEVRLGSKLVVIGLGVIGLAAASLGVLSGSQVFVISEHASSAQIAMECGVTRAFRRCELEFLLADIGDSLADAVVTTSNSWSDWSIALKLAGQHSTIAVLGFPGRQESTIPQNPLDSQYFYSKQLRVQSVGISPACEDVRGFLRFNEKRNLGFILELIESKKIVPSRFVSGVVKPSELQNAYESLRNRDSSSLTYVLQWKK